MGITSGSHHFHMPNISSTLPRCQEFVSHRCEKVKIHSHRVPPLYLVLLQRSWRRHKYSFPKSQDPRQISSLTKRQLSTEWLNERCQRGREKGRMWDTESIKWKSERMRKRFNGAEMHSFSRLALIWQDTHRWEKESEVRVCKREKGQTMLKRRIRNRLDALKHLDSLCNVRTGCTNSCKYRLFLLLYLVRKLDLSGIWVTVIFYQSKPFSNVSSGNQEDT